jgi:hypothetical protein
MIWKWKQAAAIGCLALAHVVPAEAMPVGALVVNRTDVIDVQTVCDGRGCFSYGPRQSFRPPSYRPQDFRGGTYYRPRAAVVQPYVYRPPAANPAPLARMPSAGLDRHKQGCQDRYRSYSSVTNLYKTHSGHSQPCRSPYRQ